MSAAAAFINSLGLSNRSGFFDLPVDIAEETTFRDTQRRNQELEAGFAQAALSEVAANQRQELAERLARERLQMEERALRRADARRMAGAALGQLALSAQQGGASSMDPLILQRFFQEARTTRRRNIDEATRATSPALAEALRGVS